MATYGASTLANPTGLPHGGQMARRCREPGSFLDALTPPPDPKEQSPPALAVG